MDFLITIIVVTMTLIEAQGRNFNNSFHLPPQATQQRYATKEIILYLTPSQIRALEEGRGLIHPPHVPHSNSDKHIPAQAYPQALIDPQDGHVHLHQDGQFRPHLAHPQPIKTTTVQEPQTDPFIPIISPPDYRQRQSLPYNTFQVQKQKRILKPIPFFPDDKQTPNESKALPAAVPQETIQDLDNQDTRKQLKEQWLNLLNQNIAHFKALQVLTQNQRESKENKTNFHYLSPNDHRYNEKNYASDVYDLVRSNNEHQFQKQQAFLQAEAIANSPPTVVHKETTIKHTPARFITRVPVRVPTPALVPIPESYKVKVPSAYTIPLEILGTAHLPIVNTQTNELVRAVPVAVEKHFPFPVTKNKYIDKPSEHRFDPVRNPAPHRESSPTHRHEWHH